MINQSDGMSASASPSDIVVVASRSSSQAQGSPGPDPESKRKCRMFVVEDDVALLTEVVGAEDTFSYPYSHPRWTGIMENLVALRPCLAGATAGSCKERAERLVKQHKCNDNWRTVCHFFSLRKYCLCICC